MQLNHFKKGWGTCCLGVCISSSHATVISICSYIGVSELNCCHIRPALFRFKESYKGLVPLLHIEKKLDVTIILEQLIQYQLNTSLVCPYAEKQLNSSMLSHSRYGQLSNVYIDS